MLNKKMNSQNTLTIIVSVFLSVIIMIVLFGFGEKQKVIVHIKSGLEDQHSVMMGLNKAKMAVESGKNVLVYFDVRGVNVVLKNTQINFKDFMPSQTIISGLVNSGAEVYVCPHCLMIEGYEMKDVQNGVKELKPESIFEFVKKDTISLDY